MRVWDAESGAELRVLRGHESWVTSVAFRPTAGGSSAGRGTSDDVGDCTVRVWDAESGAELRVLRGHEE